MTNLTISIYIVIYKINWDKSISNKFYNNIQNQLRVCAREYNLHSRWLQFKTEGLNQWNEFYGWIFACLCCVPVLITTGVTSRAEKGLRIRSDQVLDFRCSPGYCQNQSHTNKTKSISWLELAGCVGC